MATWDKNPMKRILVALALALNVACGLGEPSFYLGETEVYNYTEYSNDELYLDLPEAWSEMEKIYGPASIFKTTILIWPLDTDELSDDYWGMYTHWENEIELRHTYRGNPTWYSSLPHELAHRWNNLWCEGDCSTHGEEFQKKLKILQAAARQTKWAKACESLENYKYTKGCFPSDNSY